MITYLVNGNIGPKLSELKKIKPLNSNLFWKWDNDFKSWIIELDSDLDSRGFYKTVAIFCKQNNLNLERIRSTPSTKNFLADLSSPNEFCDFLEKRYDINK